MGNIRNIPLCTEKNIVSYKPILSFSFKSGYVWDVFAVKIQNYDQVFSWVSLVKYPFLTREISVRRLKIDISLDWIYDTVNKNCDFAYLSLAGP